MAKEMVKQDINLLEYPLWFQDECEAKRTQTGFVWRISKEDGSGKEFVLKTSFKPPVKTDLIFLLFLLLESQKQSWKDEIRISRYQVLKSCGLGTGAPWYERLEESLERWEEVSLEFNGVFYNGQEYKTLHFGIVDSWGIDEKTKLLRVRFSPEYLSMIKDTSYCRFLDFNQIKKLRSPLATRLYQLLVKTFKNRDTWEIDAVLLAEKIPMKQKFPAHIVLKIKPAINRIYKYTDLKVTVEERKKARGETVLVFTKEAAQPKEKPLEKKAPPFVMPENEDFKRLVSMLPPERQRQKSLLELVLREFNEKGFDFVVWNIRYANKRAIGNYPAYFLKSLQGNFGAVMQEEAEVSQVAASKKTEEAKAKHVKIVEAEAKENQESARVQEFLKSLTPEEQDAIDREAFAKLPSFVKSKMPFEEARKGNQISFRSFVRLVALEKLKARETAPTAPQQPELSEVAE